MFEIQGRNIYVIRGDTGGLELTLLSPGCEELTDYTAVLSVKSNILDSSYVLQKTCTNGKFIFTSDDTAKLTAGIYYYDIEITIPGENGSINQITTIGPAKFIIIADITR